MIYKTQNILERFFSRRFSSVFFRFLGGLKINFHSHCFCFSNGFVQHRIVRTFFACFFSLLHHRVNNFTITQDQNVKRYSTRLSDGAFSVVVLDYRHLLLLSLARVVERILTVPVLSRDLAVAPVFHRVAPRVMPSQGPTPSHALGVLGPPVERRGRVPSTRGPIHLARLLLLVEMGRSRWDHLEKIKSERGHYFTGRRTFDIFWQEIIHLERKEKVFPRDEL